MLKRRPPKFPLKMADNKNVRTIEELRKNADSGMLIKNFFQGTLYNWCKAHHYDSEADRIYELNNVLLYNICDILSIEYNDSMHIDDKTYVYPEDEISFNHVTSLVEKDFHEYAKDKINLRYYDTEFIPLNSENGMSGIVEVRIRNIITDLVLNCVVSYETKKPDKKENDIVFFERIIAIIKKTEEINDCCSIRTSGSGGYGYGLELI